MSRIYLLASTWSNFLFRIIFRGITPTSEICGILLDYEPEIITQIKFYKDLEYVDRKYM